MIDTADPKYQHALYWFKNCNWYDHFSTHDWTIKAISEFMVDGDPNGIHMTISIGVCSGCGLYAAMNETIDMTFVNAMWFHDDPECQGQDCHRVIPSVPCHQMTFARKNKAFI